MPEPLVQLPTVESPKGGGAIRGISERFQANAATGTGGMQVGLGITPGRNGFGPALALSYDSGAGNSPYGLGWSSGLASVQRKTSRGVPRYVDAEDTFVVAGGEDLVPVADPVDVTEGATTYAVTRYRPRVDRSFARVERWSSPTGDVHWRTYSPDDVCSIFGRTAGARIADPADASRVFQWMLEEQWDGRGSAIRYVYKPEDASGVNFSSAHEAHRVGAPGGFVYLKRVLYANATPMADRATPLASLSPAWRMELVFDYGEHETDTPVESGAWSVRPDPYSTYRAGFEQRTYRLVQRVLMFHRFPELGPSAEADGVLVRSTVLTHGQRVDAGGTPVIAADPVASKLLRVEQRGHRDGTTSSMPPVDLEYSATQWNDQLHVVHRDELQGVPHGVHGDTAQWVDLDGEGLPGVLLSTPEAWWYKRPEGRDASGRLRYGRLRLLQNKPAETALNDGLHQLTDLQGDGRLDLVRYAPPMSGYFAQTGTYGGAGRRTGYEGFRPLKSVPNVDFNDPNLRFLDVTGDGRADVLITEADLIVCYRSKGADGFEAATRTRVPRDERSGPRVVFSDPQSVIFVADMTGDGLSDIVRVEHRRVCYWPNLGHGRFGARVTMSNAPRLDARHQFDARRVRLADLDGSGPADLVYLHPRGVQVHVNQSGNAWSSGQEVEGLPLPANLDDVQVADLLGRGTACLVWSSRAPNARHRLAYVDLYGREDDDEAPPSAYKPHLLVKVTNNLGAETRIRYTPSTKFYLQARGTPNEWATRLHFPVQVVDRVEYEDFVSKVLLVSEYAYHHGYYDPDEREFNGFGYVEQTDTESYDAARGSGLYDDTPTGGLVGWVPPVLTKRWYDVGAWRARSDLEAALTAQAHPNPLDTTLGTRAPHARLPAAVLPSGLPTEDGKDACRALRGQLIREEVYGLDGTPAETTPYAITETQVEVRRIYSGSGAQPRDAVFVVLPRQTRAFQTERDGTEARVVREVSLEITATDALYGHVGRTASVAYGRDRSASPPFTNPEDVTWAQSATTTVEHHDTVGGVYRIRQPLEVQSWESPDLALGVTDDVDALRTALDGAAGRRLIGHAQTLYWDVAHSVERPALQGDPAGFVRRVRALAVPDALQTSVYDADTPGYAASQWADGGHEAVGSDRWASTPWTTYDGGGFRLPTQSTDPFNETTTVAYDPHGLMPTSVTNALGHVVTATIDYHALMATEVVDPNLNHVEAQFDALGAVVAVARKGKALGGGAWEGRTLAAPHEAYTYVRDAWLTRADPTDVRPNYVRAEIWTSHDPAVTDSLVSYAYTDGGGQVVLTKAQAEPGPAPLQDATTGDLILDAQQQVQLTSDTSDRWVGSGRTILNNKGAPLKQYEPYFSSVSAFDDEPQLVYESPATVLHYDPLNRPVRTQHPDGTEERIVRETWSERMYDRSDTVVGSRWDSEAAASTDAKVQRARTLSLVHDDTPTVQHLDALGRVYRTDEDNGTAAAPDLHTTTLALDIFGQPLSVTDARGNVAGTQVYDLLGRVLEMTTADGGSRWMLPTVDGQVLRAWDQRTHRFRMTYDALRRPVSTFVSMGGAAETVRSHVIYGEALGTATAQSRNLLGVAHQVYDGAGRQELVEQDFDGNPIEAVRRLRTTPAASAPVADWVAYATTPDWSSVQGGASYAAAQTAADALLETEPFTTMGVFDALGRPQTGTTPDASVTRMTYNLAGLLERVDIQLYGASTWSPYVTAIAYDAQGRRTGITYGNGTETTYAYDAFSRRLTRLLSQRSGAGSVLQDLQYWYDAAGNIVEIADGAQQTVYFDNAVVSPDRRFEYDARHRLVLAEGRCHPGQQPTAAFPTERSVPHPNDANTLQSYVQTYGYDSVGNILEMHQTRGGTTAWRRRYQYALASNRLVSTSEAGDPVQDTYYDPATSTPYTHQYTHDAHGSMTVLPGLTDNTWDADDQLAAVDLGGGGDALYLYDAEGQRVRKLIRRSATEVVERIYLDGWALYRRHQSASGLPSNIGGLNKTEEIETLHVMDDQRRVAMVETRTVDAGASDTPVPRGRYQLGDHLETCLVELTDAEEVLTYEELYPYGAVAYRARSATAGIELSAKRYRYTGKERDDETGLNYHGARYYAPWIGRWLSADPAGFVDGPNLYGYVRARPTGLHDRNGKEAGTSTTSTTAEEKRKQSTPGTIQVERPAPEELQRLGKEVGGLIGAFLVLEGKVASFVRSGLRAYLADQTLKERDRRLGATGIQVAPTERAKVEEELHRLAELAEDPEAAAKFRSILQERVVEPADRVLGLEMAELPKNPIREMLLRSPIIAEDYADAETKAGIDAQRAEAEEIFQSVDPSEFSLNDFLVMGFARTGEPEVFVRSEQIEATGTDTGGLSPLGVTILHEGGHTLGIPGVDTPRGQALEPFINQAVAEFDLWLRARARR